jgi:hypothetical protein
MFHGKFSYNDTTVNHCCAALNTLPTGAFCTGKIINTCNECLLQHWLYIDIHSLNLYQRLLHSLQLQFCILRNFELKPHLISHVAGKKSKWCQYPLAYNELVPNNAPKNADILPVQCIYCVHNHDEEKADCRGTDCPPCLAQTVRLIVMRVIMRQQLE